MPSMDVVSKLDLQELNNAVDQANREISGRFDFKGSDAKIDLAEKIMTLTGGNEFQIKQIQEILGKKLVKRNIDLACVEYGDIAQSGKIYKQTLTAREGLDKEIAKKIVKLIKDSKLKVQAAIQQEQVRVTGKSRDDLQQIIALLRAAKLDMPLQYINFRD